LLTLMSPIPMEMTRVAAYGRAELREGQRIGLSLVFDREAPAVLPPPDERLSDAVDRTADWWRTWAREARLRTRCDEAVRSALALKLLTFTPSGAILAAPTTSLPEKIGGSLNWDYRYCWPRDASLTVRALLGLGYRDEADAFTTWLLHTTRLTRPRLHVLYDLYGRGARRERTLDALEGFASSRPVRTGNGAKEQLQLDVYGEVIDAVSRAADGRTVDQETQRMLVGFGEQVCRSWLDPDEGIWEPRTGRAHHTHSLVSCWVALDRLIAMKLPGAPNDRFVENRTAIRLFVEARGFNERLQSYVQTMDGETLDASSLLFSWYGFVRADSPRMRSTESRILGALSPRPPLLYRYRSDAGEGAFAMCSFWAIEQMARGGRAEEARRYFDAMCRYANDVGLYGEEIDPATGEALGNFPQAFTHVGLINAALTLDEACV
jgi:GH15 family glucan-1,4-alpha-glucosidase